MKKIIYLSLAVLMFTSCNKKFTASFSYIPQESRALAYSSSTSEEREKIIEDEIAKVDSVQQQFELAVQEKSLKENLIASDEEVIAPVQEIEQKKLQPFENYKSELRSVDTEKSSKKFAKAVKKARKNYVKEIKPVIKDELRTKEVKAEESEALYYVLALIPPLPVGLLYGIDDEFWISLLLTVLFYLPGLIYALVKVGQYFG